MRFKTYIYLEQKNVLKELGVGGEENDYEEHIIDLNIAKDTIIGFYVLPDNHSIVLFTTIDTFRIVYDHETVMLLKDIIRHLDNDAIY